MPIAMAAITEDAREVFAEVLSQFGVPVSFDNQTKQCLMVPLEKIEDQELQGYVDNIRCRIRLMKEDYNSWQGLVERQSELVMAGERFIIASKISHPLYPWIQLLLASPS